MKSRLASIIVAIVGIGAGSAIGYSGAVMGTVGSSPIFQRFQPGSKGGDEIYHFSRLGALEVAAACGDKDATRVALKSELELLRSLEQASPGNSNPLIRVAKARAIIRERMTNGSNLASGSPPNSQDLPEEVEFLLKNAGWNNTAESHMRDVIGKLDADYCKK